MFHYYLSFSEFSMLSHVVPAPVSFCQLLHVFFIRILVFNREVGIGAMILQNNMEIKTDPIKWGWG